MPCHQTAIVIVVGSLYVTKKEELRKFNIKTEISQLFSHVLLKGFEKDFLILTVIVNLSQQLRKVVFIIDCDRSNK